MRAPFVLAAGIALATGACDRDAPPGGTAELPVGREDLPAPDQVVEDGEHIITVAGVKQAVLKAEQLYFYNESGKVIGDTIQVDFFDDGGAFVSMLTARTGEIDQQTQDMVARGDVFVRGTDATIRTEELYFDPAGDRIYSETDTEIVQQGNRIRGRGVESDPGLKRIRITGGSAVLRSEPELGRERPDTTAARRDPPPAESPATPGDPAEEEGTIDGPAPPESGGDEES
ncbi:MAG TPA: LPS export ABC transporter periplasmic protein LptC [Gemmatimonadota bacterium]|nr:LPS export ABC transporter periplasmic protein LptC [Gemmatimonadota bacterium]